MPKSISTHSPYTTPFSIRQPINQVQNHTSKPLSQKSPVFPNSYPHISHHYIPHISLNSPKSQPYSQSPTSITKINLLQVPSLNLNNLNNINVNNILTPALNIFCQQLQQKAYKIIQNTTEIMNKFIVLKQFKQSVDQCWEAVIKNMAIYLQCDQRVIKGYSQIKGNIKKFREKIQNCGTEYQSIEDIKGIIQQEFNKFQIIQKNNNQNIPKINNRNTKNIKGSNKFNTNKQLSIKLSYQQNQKMNRQLKYLLDAQKQMKYNEQILKQYCIKIYQVITDQPSVQEQQQKELQRRFKQANGISNNKQKQQQQQQENIQKQQQAIKKQTTKQYFTLRQQISQTINSKNTIKTAKFTQTQPQQIQKQQLQKQQLSRLMRTASDKNMRYMTSIKNINFNENTLINSYEIQQQQQLQNNIRPKIMTASTWQPQQKTTQSEQQQSIQWSSQKQHEHENYIQQQNTKNVSKNTSISMGSSANNNNKSVYKNNEKYKNNGDINKILDKILDLYTSI